MMSFKESGRVLWIFVFYLFFCSYAQADNFDAGRSAYISGDYKQALKILKPLAENGDPKAQKIMGIMYDYGHGVEKDSKQALQWYIKAAEQGNPDVQYHVGAKYFHGDGTDQNYAEAAKWWELAATGGQVDAQFNLGLMYYRGMVMKKDDVKAAQLFRQAAEQGHGDAEYVLGLLYSFGQGVEKNYTTALHWFQKASAQGVARAQFNMGVFYENGYGVEKDLNQARKWYERASAQGLDEASKKLADLSRLGEIGSESEATGPAAAAERGKETASAATAASIDTAADNDSKPNDETTAVNKAVEPVSTANEKTASVNTDTTGERGFKREAWVLKQPAESYTLQIGSVTNERDIIKFLRENHLEKEAAYIKVEINGGTRYNAVLGVYADYSKANAAIKSLPAQLRNVKPWVRNFGILQKMLN